MFESFGEGAAQKRDMAIFKMLYAGALFMWF